MALRNISIERSVVLKAVVSSHIFFLSSQAETNYCGQTIALSTVIK